MKHPGPASAALLERLARCVIVEPHPFVVDLENSRSMYLRTVDGCDIFDWAGLYGSKLIGYNHPRTREPDFMRRLATCANTKMANPDFLTPECVEYYELLYRLAPRCMRNDRLEVYTLNSGAEAVENMMKYFINLHHAKMRERGKNPLWRRFIHFDQAFHGRTVFALNVTHVSHAPVITDDFHGLVPCNIELPFPAFDADRPEAENRASMERTLALAREAMEKWPDEIVGLVVEPIQGAGGHRLPHPEFFGRLGSLCREFEIPWGLDEVQTAGGQCGEVFAIDLFELSCPPDAVATAKKFGNGAVYMLHSMEDKGVLDSTWGGTLADMVGFVHEWKIVEDEGLVSAARVKGLRLSSGLEALRERHPGLMGNVRGLGLYQGFSLADPADKARLIDSALEDENLLLLGAGSDSIRFRPALDVTEAEIDLLLEKLGRLLARL